MTIVGTPGVQGFENISSADSAQSEKYDFITALGAPLDDAIEIAISSAPLQSVAVLLSNDPAATFAKWLAGTIVGESQTVALVFFGEDWVHVPIKISAPKTALTYRYLWVLKSSPGPQGIVRMRIARANTVTDGKPKTAT